MIKRIEPHSGTAFILNKGERLKLIDPYGKQSADLYCICAANHDEFLSSGRSLDINRSIEYGMGSKLFSNLGKPMLSITYDTVQQHDFLMTPCNKESLLDLYEDGDSPLGCHGNLEQALSPIIGANQPINTTFSVFRRIDVSTIGEVMVAPPPSNSGDFFIVEAETDLIVGVSACAVKASLAFEHTPIDMIIT